MQVVIFVLYDIENVAILHSCHVVQKSASDWALRQLSRDLYSFCCIWLASWRCHVIKNPLCGDRAVFDWSSDSPGGRAAHYHLWNNKLI